MMVTEVLFGRKAKEKLLEGVLKATNAVKVTLGPRGRNVIIEQESGHPVVPRVTKDGVTIAESVVNFGDNIVTQGARIVVDVAKKTVKDTGDGTTTAMLLTAEMLQEGLKGINKKTNVSEFIAGMEYAGKLFSQFVDQVKTECYSDALEDVATISANNNREIGELVGEVVERVGEHGVVTTKKSGTFETTSEIKTGAVLEAGMSNILFSTDFEKEEAIYDNPLIFISDWDINQMRDEALPIYQYAVQHKRPIVLICENMSGEALHTAVMNKRDGALKIVVIHAPYVSDMRTTALEDLAIYTGGTYFAEDKGVTANEINRKRKDGTFMYPIGSCSQVIVGRHETRFIDGAGDAERIGERVSMIESKIKNSTNLNEKAMLQGRLSRLMGKVAIVFVGGSSEVDIARKTDLIDDAVHATKAALIDGIVAGGGVTYLIAADYIDEKAKHVESEDRRKGYNVVVNALNKPFRQILENAAISKRELDNKEAHLLRHNDNLLNSSYFIGINAYNMKTGIMMSQGVIDPSLVVKTCVNNAISACINLLTTEAVVYSRDKYIRYLKSTEE